MDDRELIQFARQLLSLQSFAREESQVPDLIVGTLKDRGAEPKVVARDGVRNIVAQTRGACNVIFNGHWDTVLPNEEFERDMLPVRLDDGMLYGLGACDMKSGVAAECAAFLRCLHQDIPGVALCLVGDEELGGQNGTGLLVDEGYVAPYAVLGEPTRLRLSLGQKGGMNVDVTSRGRLAHGAYPHRGDNAILKMMDFFDLLLERYPIPQADADNATVFAMTTASIGTIRGGQSTNVVPDCCEATIDIRLPPQVSVEEVETSLLEMAATAGVEVYVQFHGYGWQLDKASEIYEVSKGAVETVTQKPVAFVQKMGTNDGKYYAYHGAQITNVGPGDNRLSHTARECVPTTELTQARDIYVEIARRLAKV